MAPPWPVRCLLVNPAASQETPPLEVVLGRGGAPAIMAHFVASDGHDRERRPPVLAAARDYIEEMFGAAVADTLLLANPAAALRGAKVAAPPAKKRRRSKLF